MPGKLHPCTADNLAAILATAATPRTNGRGTESDETARARGLEDSAIAALLFQGGIAAKKSSPGALANLARQSCVACRACRTIEQWAGWDACSTQAGRGRTPPLRSRRVSEIGAATRHARHARHARCRATRDTTLSYSRGSGRAGSFLGLARAKGAGSTIASDAPNYSRPVRFDGPALERFGLPT